MTCYIGVMTGTSLDGIDCVLCDFDADDTHILAHRQDAFPPKLKAELLALCSPGDNEIERLLRAEVALAEVIAQSIKQLLHENSLSAEAVSAIGCHGQTIRHRPPQKSGERGYTLQICDISTLANLCGIHCVGDFRRADMARNGQGAPMAPVFHEALLGNPDQTQAVVNIGGMANISLKRPGTPVIGFDTGPGNVLMDHWIQQSQKKLYDHDGCWARQGAVIPALLDKMLQHPFIQMPAPKSTGRETFNANWLSQLLGEGEYEAVDIQRTLLEFTASSITLTLRESNCEKLFVCGGGAENGFLMQRLEELLPNTLVSSSNALGIAPSHMEAAAFAWFAKQTLERKPLALKQITGASGNAISGLVHYASN
jgi:anhydro-N-acetylmuramic acid kinase